MTERYKEVGAVRPGEWIKWDHRKWRKVEAIGSHLRKDNNLNEMSLIQAIAEGGWVYIKFEDAKELCSIWHDIELPWDWKPRE